MMTASFSGPFSTGGIPNGLPAVVEEATSSDGSDVGDEDFAQMSKSMSYMDARPSFHSRWVSQDGNGPRLDWIIDEGETPKPKMVVVEVRALPPLPSRSVGCGTDDRWFMANRNCGCLTLLILVNPPANLKGSNIAWHDY